MKIILLICLLPMLVFGGGAINFDGVDRIYTIDNNSLDMSTAVSVNVWVNHTDNTAGYETLLSKRVSSSSNYEIGLATGTKELYYWGGGAVALSGRTLNLSEWYMITCIITTTSCSFYSNGEFITTIATGLGSVNNGNLDIGSVTIARSQGFNGLIGNPTIFSRSLSLQEIERIYSSKNAWYPKDGLVSSWSMENNGISTGQPHPNGITIKDSAGSNDGTISDGSDNSMILESSPIRTKRGRR